MIGVRENPYIYIRACDVFVQTSRYEGKSIVLDEAKIFDKPIVVTNYPTVYDSIENDKNGIIVPMDGKQIADGIGRIWSDNALRYKLCDELKRSNIGNEKELEKYINVML
jgi:glycosyltransferase involved in cell wall biosynthesis